MSTKNIQPLYIVTGKVIKGKARGRDLGYPTANMEHAGDIPSGIYVSQTVFAEKQYQSITFVGAAETFDETDIKIETYILDFSEMIYEKELTIHLLQKLRENKKFDSIDELIRQIEVDINQARKFFGKAIDR